MFSPPGRPVPVPADNSPSGMRTKAAMLAPGMPGAAPLATTAQGKSSAQEANCAAEELAGLCREFPDFRIWREITGDRARYIARSLRQGVGPHTVVTADLDELRSVLQHDVPRRPQGQ